jgi:GNAT superfamily N-acetyltransferase
LKWVSLQEAIQLCRNDHPTNEVGQFIKSRDIEVLLKAQGMRQSSTIPYMYIRQMKPEDVDTVYLSLLQHDIPKPLEYIHRCWKENETGERISLLAFHKGEFAGWLHLLTESLYRDFVRRGIPEINNFDVVPTMRKLGIGNALMDAIERIALDNYGIVGIGVGLYENYGHAQRLYAY